MRPYYSPDFKKSVVQKVLIPGGPGITKLSKEIGVHHTSIRKWIEIYGNLQNMKKTKEWTPEAKLKAIAETLLMDENKLGEYLRFNGLHSYDLETWKNEATSGLKSNVGRPKIDPEVVELRNKEKELSKDLRRKDKALAEMSARIVLLKKSHLIWGDAEEDE